MDPISQIAERKIMEALEKGDLDDVPGQGEKLKQDDYSNIPEDLRMAYKVLKNAGCVPPEVELRKKIANTRELLAGMTDEKEKHQAMQRLALLTTKLSACKGTMVSFEESDYYEKVVDRVGKKK